MSSGDTKGSQKTLFSKFLAEIPVLFLLAGFMYFCMGVFVCVYVFVSQILGLGMAPSAHLKIFES